MRENLSQNRLAILPNRTHYDIFLAPELVTTTLPFLNGDTQSERLAVKKRRGSAPAFILRREPPHDVDQSFITFVTTRRQRVRRPPQPAPRSLAREDAGSC